ncbi:unnamed protein product, partial [Rotaria sp. Silwood2]
KQVNQSNLPTIIPQLVQNNMVHARGILACAIIQAQDESPDNTKVYAALISIINPKFPQISQLICKRVISLYRESFMADKRKKTFIMIKFLTHLINERMLHEKIAFQIIAVLLHNVSSDSVKLAIEFLNQCGQKLSQVNPQELDSHFSTLNNLLHGPLITERTKDMIRVLFTVRRNQFEEYPAIKSDEFKYDEQYEVNENEYKELRKTFLGENNDDEDKSSSNSLQNDNDQSNIPAAVIDLSSSGSSVADKEN